MDPHKEDTARRLCAPLVLHERARILGSHHFCTSLGPLQHTAG